MNTIVWAIIAFNVHYGTSHFNDQVRWATKETCEEALAIFATRNAKSIHTFKCMQVVIPGGMR